jgi:hypothetical protein
MPPQGGDGDTLRLTSALVVAAIFAAPAAAAPRVPLGFFGAAAEGPMFLPEMDVSAEFGLMARSGVEAVETEFNWSVEQPQEGAPPDFARTDRLVLAAARRRMPVLAIPVFAPPWAAVDPNNPASPPKAEPFAAYLRAAVERYGPAGTLWTDHPEVPRVPIREWQIWNEPSHAGFWSEQPFAERYVGVLRAARVAIRGADRGARIVLAGLVYDSWIQLERLYRAGAKGLFDVLSLHPYTRKLSNVIKVLRRNRTMLDHHGDKRIPILVTELSWPSSVGKADSRYGYEVTERGQAINLRDALPKLAGLRKKLRLERVYWYSWLSADADKSYPFDYAGLRKMTPKGIRSKPALAEFRKAALRLEGCKRKGATRARCG